MQQHQNPSLLQRFEQYQASKTMLFWSCAGSVVVAIIVGFAWGGWVTGGSASSMAEDSAAQARQEVASLVCVDRFMAAPDAGVQLAALKDITSSYARSKFIEDGSWAIMPVSSPVDGKSPMSVSSSDNRKAAGLCAEELAKREVMPEKAAQITDPATATVAQ